MSFISGGNTGLTYEQAQAARKRAEQMRAIAGRLTASQQAPTTFGGGLSAIGQALIARNKDKKADALTAKADAADQAGRARAGGAFNAILGAGSWGKSPQASPQQPPTPKGPNQGIADDAMAAIGKPPIRQTASGGEFANMFASSEQQYNLPTGYLARTAQIESAGNPNAQNPNSSAGGLFQFIDSTAKQYGLANKKDPVAATDAAARLARDNASVLRRALGREPTAAELYLAHQQGSGGASKLLANPNAAAASIVGRDAVRLNGGNDGMTAGQFANKWLSKFGNVGGQPQSQPQPVQVAQSGPGVEQIMAAMSNPYMSQEQKSALGAVLQQKMQQQQQANDPMRQMQIEKGQIELDRMRNPQPDPMQALQMENLRSQIDQRGKVTPTDDMREYEYARQQGFNGTFQDFVTGIKKAGAANNNITTNVGGNQAKPLGTDGQILVQDPNTASGYRVEVAEGSNLEVERSGEKESAVRVARENMALIDSIMNDPALPSVTGKFQGRMDPEGLSGMAMSQEALNLMPKIAQLQGKTFLQAFESLKGGGQITEKEGQAATAAAGRLQRYQDDASYVQGLKEMRDTIERGQLRMKGIEVPEGADPSLYRPSDQGISGEGLWSIDPKTNEVILGKSDAIEGQPSPAPNAKNQGGMTFEQFSADPSAQEAARKYGVSLEDMWEIKQGRK